MRRDTDMAKDIRDELNNSVIATRNLLESPPMVDVDGYELEEQGYYYCEECGEWYEDETMVDRYRDARPMSGMDFLIQSALDTIYHVGSDGRYLGATVQIAVGGPTIEVDTRRGVVNGYWGNERVTWSYQDTIDLDDACLEMWSCTR